MDDSSGPRGEGDGRGYEGESEERDSYFEAVALLGWFDEGLKGT